MAATGTSRPSSRNFEPSTEHWRPNRWTAEDGLALVAAMSEAFDAPPHQRMAHRDGVLHEAVFRSSGYAADLSDFAGFRDGVELRAFVRFSGVFAPLDRRDIKGMAVKLVMPDEDITDLVAMSLDVFPVRRSRHFVQLIDAVARGGARALADVLFLMATRRVSLRALIAGLRVWLTSTDYRATTYHGVQTFHLVRAARDGRPTERRPMRYRWVPESPATPADGAPLRFRLELVLGDPSWPGVEDPVRRWPAGAPTVRAGDLVVGDVINEPPGLGFNPVVLSAGIDPGEDDIFSGRAGAYPLAHLNRYRPPGAG